MRVPYLITPKKETIKIEWFSEVLKAYGLTTEADVNDLMSDSRLPRLSECRWVIMYMLYQKGYPDSEAAAFFKKERTISIFARNKMIAFLQKYSSFRKRYDDLFRTLPITDCLN